MSGFARVEALQNIGVVIARVHSTLQGVVKTTGTGSEGRDETTSR
jgi:hypothetical protein